ncbi:MAG: N-6 DNA methylase [Gemmatimonadota bacterium]|nr:N-6 DNA methylase [Gemmatimonadota bacterium]
MPAPEATPGLPGSADKPALRQQRALGAYYTPIDIARALARWALGENAGPVLDPSYGTCRFLDAAVGVLSDLGSQRPERLVHGIDVDETATAETTGALVARGAKLDQFVHCDFFRLTPDPRFAAVLGNPPYVRSHWQEPAVKISVGAAMTAAGVSLSRRASLWAPFVVHADRFVRPDGRLAMLLPGAAIQADYASSVWSHLASRYATVTLVRVGERTFADALEETVVLLADRRGAASGRVPLTTDVDSFAVLFEALNADPAVAQLRKRGRPRDRVRRNLTTRRLLDIAAEQGAACQLGDVAQVRIGTVTGANAFFVRRPDDALLPGLSEVEIIKVVPGSRRMSGAIWTTDDDVRAVEARERCRLMRLDPDRPLRGRLARAIEEATSKAVDKRSHCQRRDPWWAIPSRPAPSAFLPYMAGAPKGIVRNDIAADCINGVHRIDWTAPECNAYVLSTWTSLWAVAVEQYARHYAGGVLKLEPGSAPQLPVIRHDDLSTLDELDRLLRDEGVDAGRRFADRRVLEQTIGFSTEQVQRLRRSAVALAVRRSPRLRPRAPRSAPS